MARCPNPTITSGPGSQHFTLWCRHSFWHCKLEFELPASESVTNAWSSKLARTGTHYVLTPESYSSARTT
ncbi:cellulose binding domain-containing protein [Mycobacterium simiae]|uniref:cellulose binding domain-containing protein n=1 Tax=Mycobacterium simiae TaxID=1784 RepID=UPI00358FC161